MSATPRRAAPRRTSPHLTALHCAGKTYNMNVIHERAPAELFAALAADGPADAAAAAAPPSIGLISYELVGKKSFDLLSDEKGEVQLRADAKGRIQVTGPLLTAPYLIRTQLHLGAPAVHHPYVHVHMRHAHVHSQSMTHYPTHCPRRHTRRNATQVSGTVEQRAASAEELVALLRAASARRETASTGANAQSSRSHAVYQLSLRNGGRLLLVDLAGNEGSIETLYHSKAQMAEAAEINASLMALKSCLHARATAAPHVPSRNSTTMAMGRMHILTGYHHLLAAYQVPFRDSTLTRVLQDALTDAKATTAVLACLSPACSHFELSVRTMGVSVTLMGRDEQARQEAETLHEVGVRRGGPATWTADELRVWLAERPFAAAVALPDGATG